MKKHLEHSLENQEIPSANFNKYDAFTKTLSNRHLGTVKPVLEAAASNLFEWYLMRPLNKGGY